MYLLAIYRPATARPDTCNLKSVCPCTYDEFLSVLNTDCFHTDFVIALTLQKKKQKKTGSQVKRNNGIYTGMCSCIYRHI